MTAKTLTSPKYPKLTAVLTGTDGNIFAILGCVQGLMRRNKIEKAEIDAFLAEAMASESYHAALAVVMRWVNVR